MLQIGQLGQDLGVACRSLQAPAMRAAADRKASLGKVVAIASTMEVGREAASQPARQQQLALPAIGGVVLPLPV